MNHRSTLIAVLAFLVFAFSADRANTQGRAQLSQATTASSTMPRTVLDFYMLLTPDQFGPLEVIENRGSVIAVRDIKHGYLKLDGKAYWEGSGESALFKKSDGSYLVAVALTSCGPICGTNLKFFKYLDGQGLDVTNKVMPDLPDALLLKEYRRITGNGGRFQAVPVLFDLPRVGKSIKVRIDSEGDDESGHPAFQGDGTVLKLRWDGERFAVEKMK